MENQTREAKDVFLGLRLPGFTRVSWILWFFIVLIGLGVRIYILSQAGSFWFDEAVSYSLAQIPIPESWQYLQYENNPPLYYWLLGLWGWVFGFGEIPLRGLSLLFGGLSFWAIIRFGSKLFNPTVGFWAGAIYALSSYAIFFDTEVRMYSPMIFLLIMANYHFFCLLEKTWDARNATWYVFFMSLSFYMNISALSILVAHMITLFWVGPHKKARLKIASLIIVSGFLFLPWLILFVIERAHFSEAIAPSNWWYFNHSGSILSLLAEPIFFFNYFSQALGTIAISVAFIASIVSLGVFFYLSKRDSEVRTSVYWLTVCSFVVPLIMFSYLMGFFAPRYYAPSIIYFWLILAYLFYRLSQPQRGLGKAVAIVCFIVYGVSNLLFVPMTVAHPRNWDEVATWIDLQKPDVVLATSKLWTAQVYASSSFLFVLPPGPIKEEMVSADSLERVVRLNYNWGSASYRLSAEEKSILAKDFREIIATSSRVVFASQGGVAQKAMIQMIQQEGFRCRATIYGRGVLDHWGREALLVGLFERQTDNRSIPMDKGCVEMIAS